MVTEIDNIYHVSVITYNEIFTYWNCMSAELVRKNILNKLLNQRVIKYLIKTYILHGRNHKDFNT